MKLWVYIPISISSHEVMSSISSYYVIIHLWTHLTAVADAKTMVTMETMFKSAGWADGGGHGGMEGAEGYNDPTEGNDRIKVNCRGLRTHCGGSNCCCDLIVRANSRGKKDRYKRRDGKK